MGRSAPQQQRSMSSCHRRYVMMIMVLLGVVMATTMCVDAYTYVSNPTWPHKITVTSPASLAGTIRYAPPFFGPTIQAGGLNIPIRFPNAADGAEGRQGCLQTGVSPTMTDDFGQSLAGSALLIQRGTCIFEAKVSWAQAVGASLLIIYNRAGDDSLEPATGKQVYTVPNIFISATDGATLIAARRADSATEIMIYAPGSGALVASELAALNTMVAAMPFAASGQTPPSVGNVRLWSTQAANPTLDPCTDRLVGVWCEDGHITALQIETMNFAANSPLPSAINDFTQLALVLSLGNVGLTGPLPCMNALTKLAHLDIRSNAFTSIPDCTLTGPASTLAALKAGSNQITSVGSSLASLTALTVLDLSNNLIQGTLPTVASLTGLTQYLINDNQFTGSLPSFKDLSAITKLSVRNNKLTGGINLDHFDGCLALTELDISNNDFTGSLTNLIDCTNLQILDLSFNHFTGVLPPSWGDLVNLKSLIVSNNQLLSPIIPVASMDSLETLDMSHNQLTTFADDADLDSYDSPMAAIVAYFPAAIISAYFGNNNFTGIIDYGWCCSGTPKLRDLDFSYNQLASELPFDLWGYDLSLFDVSYNQLSGIIPLGLPTTKWQTIKFIGNQMQSSSRSLPDWVSRDNTRLLKEAGTQFVCPTLGSTVRASAIVTIDASYYDYSYCQCDAGTYGTPPECQEIPAKVGVNLTSYQTGVAQRIISDAGFGDSRVKPGMDTAWLINSTESVGPNSGVLGVKVTLYFTSSFSSGSGNSLSVYEGGTDLTGSRTAFYVADGSSTSFNASVWVLSKIATINFQSREESGTHFVASVEFAYTCPELYYVSNGQCIKEAEHKYRDFQKILGVLVLIWQCISMIAAALLLYFKRNERQVGLQSAWFLAASIIGFFFIIEPPIVGIVNDTFPCGVTYWFDLLWQPILMTCVFMIMGRLYIYKEIQKMKKRLLSKKKDQKMDPRKTARIAYLGSLITQRSQILLTVALMAVPVITIIVSYGAHISNYQTPNTNCGEDTRLDVIQLAYWILYEVLLIIGLVGLKDSRDAFGLSRRIGQFIMYYSVISVIYFVLKFAARSSQINPFDYRYLSWLIVALFQIFFIIKPLLKTFPFCQRGIDEKDVEPLDEMLNTKLGMAYMQRHCEEEFSVENILCWSEIEKFKRKTTIQGYQTIVAKFIGPKAQMQVNIGRTMERKALELNDETKLEALGTSLQSALDEIQTELFNLILRDSYPRFLASTLAKRYVQKLPLPQHENDGAQSTAGMGAGTDRSDERDHSTGSHHGGGTQAAIELQEEKKKDVAITIPLSPVLSPVLSPQTADSALLKTQSSQSLLLSGPSAVSP